MLDPHQLAALAAIQRRGSFELAAAELNVSPSAISQRLKVLEERVGTLLVRRGQPCQATKAGLRLIRHHDELVLLEQALAADLPTVSAGPALLRIAVNADSLATWVIPALARVDDFLYDIVIADQDISQDLLRRGEVSAAITSHPGPLQGCDTLPLGQLRYLATASPAFMARWFADGVTPAALSRAPALIFSQDDRLQDIWVNRATGGQVSAGGFPAHRLASSHGFVAACKAGLGWGLNPEPLVAPALRTGEICTLLPDAPLDVALYWQFARLTAPSTAGLTAAILAAARGCLLP